MAHEELAVLLGEDVVGDDAEAVAVAEPPAQGEEQGRLAAAHRAADADRERAAAVVARVRLVAFREAPGPWSCGWSGMKCMLRVLLDDGPAPSAAGQAPGADSTIGTDVNTADRGRPAGHRRSERSDRSPRVPVPRRLRALRRGRPPPRAASVAPGSCPRCRAGPRRRGRRGRRRRGPPAGGLPRQPIVRKTTPEAGATCARPAAPALQGGGRRRGPDPRGGGGESAPLHAARPVGHGVGEERLVQRVELLEPLGSPVGARGREAARSIPSAGSSRSGTVPTPRRRPRGRPATPPRGPTSARTSPPGTPITTCHASQSDMTDRGRS